MELVTNHGHTLFKLFDAIKELVDNANVIIDENGLNLSVMDSSHVALITMSFKRSCFQTFDLPKPEAIGLKLKSVCTILKETGTSSRLTLSLDGDVLVFKIESQSQENGDLKGYRLKLLDLDSEHMNVPDNIKFDCIVKMNTKVFHDTSADLKVWGDSSSISIDENGMTFLTEGDNGCAMRYFDRIRSNDTQTKIDGKNNDEKDNTKSDSITKAPGTKTIENDDDEEEATETDTKKRKKSTKAKTNKKQKTLNVDIMCHKPVKKSYSLKFLELFSKAKALCEFVTLKFEETQPLFICYNVLDDDLQEIASIQYCLAPRIE